LALNDAARTWTDSTGKFPVRAEFVEFKEGKVRLRKENGKEVTLPIARLSQPDRELVQQQAKGKPIIPADFSFWRESVSMTSFVLSSASAVALWYNNFASHTA
jgi:hypothetical protein